MTPHDKKINYDTLKDYLFLTRYDKKYMLEFFENILKLAKFLLKYYHLTSFI